MIEAIKLFIGKWALYYSLSKPRNWDIIYKVGWGIRDNSFSSPRITYRHKRYMYYITNEYMFSPESLSNLVRVFMIAYEEDCLVNGHTLVVTSP